MLLNKNNSVMNSNRSTQEASQFNNKSANKSIDSYYPTARELSKKKDIKPIPVNNNSYYLN
jgi:hypothetical protein